MKRLWILITGLLLVGCGGSSEFSAVGPSETVAPRLPLVLQAVSGSVNPMNDVLEVRLVPKGESALVGENGEGGIIALEEFVSRLNSAAAAPPEAELKYKIGERIQLRRLTLLDARRDNEGAIIVLRATVSSSTALQGSQLRAQTAGGSGRFQVSVSDEEGLGLSGAVVEAVHQPTGTRYSTVTQSDGRGEIFNARVGGPYILTAYLDGFVEQSQENIFLGLGETLPVRFELHPGGVPETFGEATLLVRF